jgi:hypothetical protein
VTYRSPEALLNELGITEPHEIDLEAIAYHCGATVRYRKLDGCSARILGLQERAIISVDSNSGFGRQRFSIGHELGHWMRDKGKSGHLCQQRDMNAPPRGDSPEALANAYSADLLMPQFMFKPLAAGKEPTFETVRELGKVFRTSRPATAIRLVQYGYFPSILLCYGIDGQRRWFTWSQGLQGIVWPQRELSHNTQAFEVLYGGATHNRPVKATAADWIECRRSYGHHVFEHSVKIDDEMVLTLLWWKSRSELDALIG